MTTPVETWRALTEAWREGDWSRMRGYIADDFVGVDHRPLGFGEVHGGDALQTYLRGIQDVVPDARVEEGGLLGENERALAALINLRGGAAGAPVEIDYILVSEVLDGCITRAWYFSLEARDEALQTFAAL